MVYTGGSGKSQVEIRCETLPLAFRQTSITHIGVRTCRFESGTVKVVKIYWAIPERSKGNDCKSFASASEVRIFLAQQNSAVAPMAEREFEALCVTCSNQVCGTNALIAQLDRATDF